MAEVSVARVLKTGTADGDHASAVMITSSVSTSSGSLIFRHFLDSLVGQINSGAAQARGLVLVALSTCPESYVFQGGSCVQVVDGFSDPLGWERLLSPPNRVDVRSFHELKDLNALFTTICEVGKAMLGDVSKSRFAVAIDSISLLLRHHSLAVVSRFISQLRALEFISAIVWYTHSSLHQHRVLQSLEYLATTTVFVEPQLEFLCDGESDTGRLRTRQKRRTGRIREQVDEFKVGYQSIKFSPIELGNSKEDSTTSIHKVQFRLDLSEKELEDRAKVVLPFEHQGNGREGDIYDGRKFKSSEESETSHIHYVRDSDDECPDSDEDPDDDLDI